MRREARREEYKSGGKQRGRVSHMSGCCSLRCVLCVVQRTC